MRKDLNLHSLTLLLGLALCVFGPLSVSASELTSVSIEDTGITWQPNAPSVGYRLVISGPSGLSQHLFAAGETPSFSVFDGKGFALADGQYTWELRSVPAVEAEKTAVGGVQSHQESVQWGYFVIEDGAFVPSAAPAVAKVPVQRTLTCDTYTQDAILEGNMCIGLGCVSCFAFDDDTLRLKEAIPQIRFEDTTASENDWTLTADGDTFTLDDIDSSTTPLTVEAGAPSNSLYVDDVGRVGLGTATPAAHVHIVSDSEPTLRLENTSSGSVVSKWDVSGDDTEFAISDETSTSLKPFSISAGAPSDSISVDGGGDVGMGTSSPDATLHVIGAMRIDETDADEAPSELLVIKSDSDNGAKILYDDGNLWKAGAGAGNTFTINDLGDTAEFILNSAGDLFIKGTLTENSDVNAKENFSIIDPQQILRLAKQLPILTWNYKEDDELARHLGPMAQDFYASFGLGGTNTGIAPRNLAAVALAALQGLDQVVEDRTAQLQRENAELQQENVSLGERLAALEAKINSMSGN